MQEVRRAVMKLEEHSVYIKQVEFGDLTSISNNVLTINREELADILRSDKRLHSVSIELARPGENCRIVRVADIIEPRIKKNGPGQVFPGIVGPLEIVGSGQTVCLKGVAVVETWQLPSEVVMLIDMNGPVAELSHFSSTQNIVLIARPREGISKYEYASALKKAGLTAATYLARAALNVEADEVTVYDLDRDRSLHSKKLPRVAYICQLFSHKELIEPLIYGSSFRNILPSLINPNEFFDGAIVNFQYDSLINSETTYSFQNHPVIKELYSRHGKECIFAGVILKDAPSMLGDKERSALLTAKLAKWSLGVDGVIITKEGGGHPQVDMSLTSEKCAELGIGTVLMLTEFLSTTGSSDETVIFNTKSADAVVSCGMSETITIPPQKTILGDEPIEAEKYKEQGSYLLSGIESARRGGTISNRVIRGALSQFGEAYLTTVEY